VDSFYALSGSAFAHIRPVDDLGERWQVNLFLHGKDTNCLAVDPKSKSTVYVGMRSSGLWKTVDEGRTWRDLRLPQMAVFSVAVSPVDGAVYAGCEPSRLWRSGDGGETWEALDHLLKLPSAPGWSFPPRPWTSHIRAIALNPVDPQRLLVGIEKGGVMLSLDGGDTWMDHPKGAQRDAHALAWHASQPLRAYEAGGDGTSWSLDGGLTWQSIDEGRDRNYTHGLAIDPEDPDCWFVSASTSGGAAHGGLNAQAKIYRWHGAGPWQSVSDSISAPLPAFPYALVTRPGQVAAGMGNGQIYISGDLGDHWQPLILEGDPIGNIHALAFGE